MRSITLALIGIGVVGTGVSVVLLSNSTGAAHAAGGWILFLLAFLVLPLGILLVPLLGTVQFVRRRRDPRRAGAAPAGGAVRDWLFLWLALVLLWLVVWGSVFVALFYWQL